MSSGDFPPAAAQLSKYQVSHNRGLIASAPVWPTAKTSSPPAGHSTTNLIRRSFFAPRPAREPLVPKRCCPAGCEDHRRTEPVPTSGLAGSPKPCGTVGGVLDWKVLPPLEPASPPPRDATKHPAREIPLCRKGAANVLD